MASSVNENAGGTLVDNAALDAVQRAMALVRNTTRKLSNPVPASRNNLTSGFLTSLLEPVQQQQTLLDFNPLDAKSFAELAMQAATQPKAAVAPAKARTAAQDDFVKAVVAATAKAGQKATTNAVARAAVSPAATGVAVKASAPKFTLVKPSLQDVNTQLIGMWNDIAATSPSPELKKLAQNNSKMLQQINSAIAPRAAAGRSTGATLGKLLQQIGELTDEGIASLVKGRGVGGMIEDAFGQSQRKPTKPAPTPPPALVKLAEIVGEVWQQTFPSSDTNGKPAPIAKKYTPTTRPASKPATPVEESAEATRSGSSLASTTPATSAGGAVSTGNNSTAAPVDFYAIATGLNDVLREQAWLAGVDLT